jgi:hypothetical protein
MGLDPNVVAGLWLLGISQTGALVFFAGSVNRALGDHDRRLDKVEEKLDKEREGKK